MKLYCSICGIELVHSRKAVPGKGHIFDVVEPHECEGYAIKANEDESPTVMDVLENLKDLGKTIKKVSDVSTGPQEPGDRRADKSDITSSAPGNLLRSLRDLPPSEEGDLD